MVSRKKRGRRQENKDRRRETGDGRRETGDGRKAFLVVVIWGAGLKLLSVF